MSNNMILSSSSSTWQRSAFFIVTVKMQLFYKIHFQKAMLITYTTSVSIPWPSKNLTISRWPSRAAMCSGVSSSWLVFAFKSYPYLQNSLTHLEVFKSTWAYFQKYLYDFLDISLCQRYSYSILHTWLLHRDCTQM